ncbi:unnamed protein product [Rotaria sp. Silwood1]|nr:unnamed protein product [Rotaria sp. Silwood1]
MHCCICKIDCNTLSTYVKHQRDLHSHSKNIRLICPCDGSFSSLRSLQAHWCCFHKEEELHDEDMQQDEQEEYNDVAMIHRSSQEDYPLEDVQESRDLKNMSTDIRNAAKDLSEEELLEVFEKRILYPVLTLQTVFYTSEAAIEFVVSSLMELFLAISTTNLV